MAILGSNHVLETAISGGEYVFISIPILKVHYPPCLFVAPLLRWLLVARAKLRGLRCRCRSSIRLLQITSFLPRPYHTPRGARFPHPVHHPLRWLCCVRAQEASRDPHLPSSPSIIHSPTKINSREQLSYFTHFWIAYSPCLPRSERM